MKLYSQVGSSLDYILKLLLKKLSYLKVPLNKEKQLKKLVSTLKTSALVINASEKG